MRKIRRKQRRRKEVEHGEKEEVKWMRIKKEVKQKEWLESSGVEKKNEKKKEWNDKDSEGKEGVSKIEKDENMKKIRRKKESVKKMIEASEGKVKWDKEWRCKRRERRCRREEIERKVIMKETEDKWEANKGTRKKVK